MLLDQLLKGCGEGSPPHYRWVWEPLRYVLNVTGSPCTKNVCWSAILGVQYFDHGELSIHHVLMFKSWGERHSLVSQAAGDGFPLGRCGRRLLWSFPLATSCRPISCRAAIGCFLLIFEVRVEIVR